MSAKKTDSEQLLVFMVGDDYPHSFIHWPLHITIVPWFSVSADREAILDALLTKLAAKHRPMPINVEGNVTWGERIVDLIEQNNDLSRFHDDVLSALDGANFIIHNRQYVGAQYRPHITRQASGRVSQKKLNLTKFALIKQVKNSQTGEMLKQIVKEYSLG